MPGRFTPRENRHVTLAFLGNVPASALPDVEEAIDKSAAGVRDITLLPDRLGKFGRSSGATFWLGLAEDPNLTNLAERLREELRTRGISFDDKPFLAHITLARRARIPKGDLPPLPFPGPTRATHVALFKSTLSSEGASYEELYGVDLEPVRQSPQALPNTVLGHEFVGVIEQVGESVTKLTPGDRVAVSCETFCGECFYCKRGWVNNCVQGGWELGCRIDGCQAEFVRVPFAEQTCSIIPDNVANEDALFLGDIVATGQWSAEIAELERDCTVAVIGAGPVGLATMMCAKLTEPECIIAIDIDAKRLALAREHGLADKTIDASQMDLAAVEAAVRSLTEGRGADAVVEAAGGSNTFEMAWRIARPNAVVVISAMYERPQTLPLHEMYGKNLVFKTGGVDANNLDKTMSLVKDGRIDTSCLVSKRYPLNDILEAAFEQRCLVADCPKQPFSIPPLHLRPATMY